MEELPTVSVRELRQNLSVYLRRVEAGEALSVTSHGRPVAMLAPRSTQETAWDRLVAEGKIMPAKKDLADLPAPPDAEEGFSISQALEDVREDST